ncbi:MAG: hypothetical protein GWN16_04245, partial [Calditrichae bacterium]|nr:hypothetical protein [Calditrichia bacterium]
MVDKIQAETNFHSNPTIIAAAHPFDKPPASHRLVLNRGYWHDRDLAQPELDYWQILNGKTDNFFYKGLEAWKSALLRGNRIGILAGTDAHGNFNCSRQIAIPLLKMFRNKQQLLGQTRSGVFMEDRIDRSKLIKHLKEKRVIISNGPAAKLIVEQNQGIYAIGSSINAHVPFSVAIKAISTAEFGSLQDIHLFIGNFAEKQETREIISVEQNVFSHEASMDFPHGLPPGYLRLEAYTSNGLKDRFCLTNPVWIGQT